MTCARSADLDAVERYMLGHMDEAEQASFEAHFFECPDCFAAVQAMQATQSVLRNDRQQDAVPEPQPTPSNRVVEFSTHAGARNGNGARTGTPLSRLLASGATWIGLAAAASLAGLLIWTPWRAKAPATGSSAVPATTVAQQRPPKPEVGPGQLGPGQPAAAGAQSTTQGSGTQGITAPTAQASGTGATTGGATGAATRPGPGPASIRPSINLDTLALLTPPPYVPLQTRGAEAASDEAFAAAMRMYTAKNYRGAIDALKAVVDSQPNAMHAQFFLGVSYLAIDQPSAASAVLTRVAASNVAPFADEAHLYLAKAAMRTGDLDRAERELSTAIEAQAGPPHEASRLLQVLRLYRREHAPSHGR
jgi:TolA-binding protein